MTAPRARTPTRVQVPHQVRPAGNATTWNPARRRTMTAAKAQIAHATALATRRVAGSGRVVAPPHAAAPQWRTQGEGDLEGDDHPETARRREGDRLVGAHGASSVGGGGPVWRTAMTTFPRACPSPT